MLQVEPAGGLLDPTATFSLAGDERRPAAVADGAVSAGVVALLEGLKGGRASGGSWDSCAQAVDPTDATIAKAANADRYRISTPVDLGPAHLRTEQRHRA